MSKKIKTISIKELKKVTKFFKKEQDKYGTEAAVHNLLWIYDIRTESEKV